jgi:phosphopantothenoylcysteine decarboxylase / phosphopantothenate---cysteine ligase
VWQGRQVVLGVTGGIAAYKSVLLARALSLRGAAVDVLLTRSARQFVGEATFAGITRRPVRSSIWEPDGALAHITLGRDADLLIVAPATANFLARAAAGIADDLLTTTVLAATCPILAAPAMNDDMYANEATRTNLATLHERGWRMVGPAVGALAEGPSDRPGRMAEPVEILAHAERLLTPPGPLAGHRVTITAGPTREPIDPVRFISNRSSGKMGYRLAEAAWRRGAEVTLITGPSSEAAPTGVAVVSVVSTAAMKDAVADAIGASDVLIMAAAPADFRPAEAAAEKIPREGGTVQLDLVPTDDILVSTAPHRGRTTTVVGFALETADAEARGRAKLERKGLDLIVINDANETGAGFDADTNAVTIVDRRGGVVRVSLRSKADVADAILDAVEAYRG